MKKAVILLVVFIATILLASCEKEEIPVKAPEKIRIFIGAQSSLKSTASESSSEVKNGDTVSFPRGINALMYAENQYGQAVSGNWCVAQKVSDNPSNYYDEFSERFSYDAGDQFARKFGEYGIYKVSFGKFVNFGVTDTLLSFYVYIKGAPGKIGDNPENGSIFRLEKKELYDKDSKLCKRIFVYFKYQNSVADQQAYANLWVYKDMADMADIYKQPISFKATRWPFSKEKYYYFIFDPSQYSGYSYKVRFEISDNGGKTGAVDPNTYISSWTNSRDGIEFSLQ